MEAAEGLGVTHRLLLYPPATLCSPGAPLLLRSSPPGRLIFQGNLILILLEGEAPALKDYLVRHRTESVDVDSHGRRCAVGYGVQGAWCKSGLVLAISGMHTGSCTQAMLCV